MQPGKFMLLILQIIAFSVIINVRDQHIFEGINKQITDREDVTYMAAERHLLAWAVLGLLCNVAQLLIIFFGRTLFNDKHNMQLMLWQSVGLIATILYLAYCFHYKRTVWLFILGGALPLGIEFSSLTHATLNYMTGIAQV